MSAGGTDDRMRAADLELRWQPHTLPHGGWTSTPIPLAPGETAQPLPCGWPEPPHDDHEPAPTADTGDTL